MKYYYSLLRRRTGPARWGLILGAVVLILLASILLPLLQKNEMPEMNDITDAVPVFLARFVLFAAFFLELFRSVWLVFDDRFGHLLPEQERKPLLAVLVSLLASAVLYSLSALLCTILDSFFRTGQLPNKAMLWENFHYPLASFVPAVVVQLLFTITLVMFLQLFFRRLGQITTLGKRLPRSAANLITFLLTMGIWTLLYSFAMRLLFRWPLVLDVLNGVVSRSLVLAGNPTVDGNLLLWPLTMTEAGQTVLSVPVLVGMILLSMLQWILSVILVEDRLDWEV